MSDDPTASTEAATATEPRFEPESREQRAAAADRSADLVLAGIHLRLGSLALARAELETLAGRDVLDDAGILDLAEARWRSGDVEGAGEAAALLLDDEEGPLVALIVAAEAAAARGRPTEARRLAAKALVAADGRIDQVFAGMPRSPAWPPDPAAPPPSPTTMFDPPAGTSVRQTSRPARSMERPALRREVPPPTATPAAPSTTPDEPAGTAATMGLWGEDTSTPNDGTLPSATDALDGGRAALERGDLDEAATQLAFVLRLSSALAPAVLDLIAERAEPSLAFVRGDAFRLVGREVDARRAYARAVGPASSADPTPAPSTHDPADQGDPT